ncbi:MAG: sulfatase-like hydrolase/transferase [Lentisphaerales bacterium]|nr:sulfatase-like hydrolase/transferase [Lentisphaerales bacterium]
MMTFVKLRYLILLASLIFPVASIALTKQPNIILVMADDQGWADTAYNGHKLVQTPHLDDMAAKGFILDRFYAAAPVCSPTRASVLTGRHPFRTRVTNHGRYIRPHEYTVAEALKSAGYVTGIFGKVHLGSGQPGSDCNPSAMGFDEWCIGLNFFDMNPYLSRNGKVEQRKGKGSVILIDDTIEFLRKHQAGKKPIFAVAWFPSPHTPHKEKATDPSLYKGIRNASYYQEITLLDEQLGRLRTALKDMEMAENTILWYCSDNGGLLKESSGGREKKGSIYEGGLRVPGIVEWPAKGLKGKSAVPMSTSDMFPTLLSMVGIQAKFKHSLDGQDMSGVFWGQRKSREKAMGFWHNFEKGEVTYSDKLLKDIMFKQKAAKPTPHNPYRMSKDVHKFPSYGIDTSTGHSAWNDWPWKLHLIDGQKYELYNLEADPMEKQNLVGNPKYKQRVQRMKTELQDWMKSVIRSLNGEDYLEIKSK